VACARARRDPAEVQLIAVSKGVSFERVRLAAEIGLTTLGENRVQEAEPKIRALTGVRWHMVGRLQSNKAVRAAELFDAVHSVDSVALAERLARAVTQRGRPAMPIYLQVNIDADPAKAGFTDAELAEALPRLADSEGIELAGLMTIGRLVTQPAEARPTFAALRELRDRLRAQEPRLGEGLSMGMSDDYEQAVEEGATAVRIGRAIFGGDVR
jgi:PLP dependent protein